MFGPVQELFIKVCGITNTADAKLACTLGANALGFNFSKFSKYYISPEHANLIIKNIPDYVSKIGVFEGNEDLKYVQNILKQVPLSAVQLEGNYAADDLVGFDASIIKAFLVDENFDVEIIKNYLVDAFLLKSKNESKEGGARSFNWDIAIKAKEYGRVILSGGLDPDNIESALRIIQPYGVDVCEGIELKKGKKDPDMMREFIARARNVEIRYEMDEE